MTYHIDRTAQLEDAVKKGYGALAKQLRDAGTPTRQHNPGVKKTKKSSKPATAKKTAAKKSATAKKTAAKKTTKKS